MKSVSSIISALAKEDNVKVIKGLECDYATVGQVNAKGRATVTVRLADGATVRGPIQVNTAMINNANAAVKAITEALKTAKDDDAVKLNEELAEAKVVAAAKDGDWIIGRTNTIFLTNFSIMAVLRRMPELRFLVKMIQNSPSIIEDILNVFTMDVVAEEVVAGQLHKNPFSERDKAELVPNNSVYYSVFGIELSAYGVAAVKAWRKVKVEEDRQAYIEAKKKAAKASLTDDDDDDDED